VAGEVGGELEGGVGVVAEGGHGGIWRTQVDGKGGDGCVVESQLGEGRNEGWYGQAVRLRLSLTPVRVQKIRIQVVMGVLGLPPVSRMGIVWTVESPICQSAKASHRFSACMLTFPAVAFLGTSASAIHDNSPQDARTKRR